MICSHRNPGRCRPVDGGHCGTVRNMRDAGALRDECGFAECVWLRWDERGAHNCPHRWVKCKRGKRKRRGASVCHGCMNYCMCIYFALQKPQANELSSVKPGEENVTEIFKLRQAQEKKLKRG